MCTSLLLPAICTNISQQKYEIRSDGLDIPRTLIGIELRSLFLMIAVSRFIVGVEWRYVNKDTDT